MQCGRGLALPCRSVQGRRKRDKPEKRIPETPGVPGATAGHDFSVENLEKFRRRRRGTILRAAVGMSATRRTMSDFGHRGFAPSSVVSAGKTLNARAYEANKDFQTDTRYSSNNEHMDV